MPPRASVVTPSRLPSLHPLAWQITALLASILLTSCDWGLQTGPDVAFIPSVKYADCKVWGEKGFDRLQCIFIQVAPVSEVRLLLIRDDGVSIIPHEETVESVKERFQDAIVEDDGTGDVSVKAGGLIWEFRKGQLEPQSVEVLWREDWRVLNTKNGSELSFPCTLSDVVRVLGRDCVATDHRGRKVQLPEK